MWASFLSSNQLYQVQQHFFSLIFAWAFQNEALAQIEYANHHHRRRRQKENEKAVPEAEKKKLEDALGASKKILENTDASIDELKTSLTELTTASHGLSSVLYEKQKNSAESPPPPQGGGADSGTASDGSSDDVIDAEYKDVNKKDT